MTNLSAEKILFHELFAAMEPLLDLGQSVVFRVSGNSMWPFLCSGRDSVIIQRIDPANLQIGDVVLLKVPLIDKYLLHRITGLRKESGQIQTTGDGNCFRDGWFPVNCVAAVVTELESRGKKIPVTNTGYRILSTLWRILFPCRSLLLWLLRKASAIKQKFRRK